MYFMVKGETSLFYFKKYTYTQHFSKTIWNSINWFDRLHFWEFAIIGVLDDVANGKCENGTENSKAAYPLNIKGGDAFYPTYCNNPTMAMEGPNGQNPHATTFYTSYPGPDGVESSFNAERENFDNWCAGHEHGHQIQGAYNLESCSESSVNLPSNIITYLTGYRLGRGWNFAQNYAYVAENKPFGLRDISITLRMYYNLFLYYHIGGKKKDFYPTFVKSLREDPMDFSKDGVQYEHPEWGTPDGGHHRAVNTWIKFYKKACDAAQEDLTEYFRMWGFFVPCDKEYFGDYTSYAVSLTQKEIDDAIAEVKAKGYPENLQIMFVEDRQIMRERTDIWAHTATGTKKYKPTNWDAWYTQEQLNAEYGDVGDILTYIDGSANTSEYTYTQSGNKITLMGKGGVGFIVYDLEGNNRYMSNRLEFEIPVELVLNGFEIKSINANGTSNTVGADAETDYEQLKGMLETLLSEAQEIIDITITGNSYRPGFYYVDSEISEFNSIYNYAKNIYDKKNQTSYQDAYLYLKQAMEDVKNNASTLPFVPNSTYVLTNKKYSDKSMDLNASGALCATTTDPTKASQQWVMESATEKDTYYIKNKSTGKYLGTLDRSVQISANVETQSSAKAYKLYNLGNALWALQCQTEKEQMSLHTDGGGNVVGWSHTASDNDGSWWYLTAVEVDEDPSLRNDLQNLIEKTEKLMGMVGEVSASNNKMNLTESNYLSNAECKETAYGDQFTSYSVLCDNDPGTFFHSDYSSQAPNEDHYIRIDVGKGNEVQYFDLYYTTRKDGNLCAPTKMAIEGSADGEAWDILTDITSGLPTTNNTSHTISGIGNGKVYRYIRMRVYGSSTGQKANEHYYFIVSELGLNKISYNEVVKDEFASMQTGLLLSAYKSVLEANWVLETATTAEELGEAYKKLNEQYEKLHNAYSEINEEKLNAKKAELKEWIDKTTELLNKCGTVSYAGGVLPMQTTNEDGKFYLSTNAPEPKEGAIAKLLDNDPESFFHSAYSHDINEVHHLKVHVADEDISNAFTFTYQAKKGPFPYEIKVYGANSEDGDFELFATFSKDDTTNPLPTSAKVVWTSGEVSPTKAYRYLRFDVTNSGASGINANPYGEYCFVMSEFGLTLTEKYTITLNGVGAVTEELLKATYIQKEKANAVYTYATTMAQIESAIDDLCAAYEALEEVTKLRYRITDNAGNVFAGTYEGEAGVSEPTFTGAEGYSLSDKKWNDGMFTATITFPVPVSSERVLNPTMISNFNESKKWHAVGEDVKVQTTAPALSNLTEYLWTIYPSLDNGEFRFTVKNHATGKWVTVNREETSFNAQGTVTLTNNATKLEIITWLGAPCFKLPGKTVYLTINSSSDADVYLATWTGGNDNHNGNKLLFPSASYTVGITSAKAATLFTPIAVSIPQGVTAKYVKAEGDNIGSEGRLIYTKLNGIIPANTAVVLTGEEGTYTFLETKETGEQVEGNVLFGYAEKTAVEGSEHEATGEDGTVYALANKDKGVAFYHYVGENYLAGKAYLDVKDLSAGTGVRLFNIFDEETETGVTETESEHVKAEIYDLTGRRVREARNGLYIVNGKRVIR